MTGGISCFGPGDRDGSGGFARQREFVHYAFFCYVFCGSFVMASVGLDRLVEKLRKRADDFEEPFIAKGTKGPLYPNATQWYSSPNYAITTTLREVAQQMENLIRESKDG
jgi:hypothetical protein